MDEQLVVLRSYDVSSLLTNGTAMFVRSVLRAGVDCRARDYERRVNSSQPSRRQLPRVLGAASKSPRNVSRAPGVSILTGSPPTTSSPLGNH